MFQEEAVASFTAFTGATPDEAAMFLEMSGGSVDLAVEFFFSSGGGGSSGGSGGFEPAAASPRPPVERGAAAPPAPDWFTLVWGLPPSQHLPDAWLLQPLQFAEPTAPGAPHQP
jgi:hypothetical protein